MGKNSHRRPIYQSLQGNIWQLTHSASPSHAIFLKIIYFFKQRRQVLDTPGISPLSHYLQLQCLLEYFTKHRFRTLLNTNGGFVSRHSHFSPVRITHSLFKVYNTPDFVLQLHQLLHPMRHCIHNASSRKSDDSGINRDFFFIQQESCGRQWLMLNQ